MVAFRLLVGLLERAQNARRRSARRLDLDGSTAGRCDAGDAIRAEHGGRRQGRAGRRALQQGRSNRLKSGSYKTAAKDFAEVERQHPYSSWATKAMLMQAYAQYQRNAYDDAINAAKRFITLHPGHKDAAYAYYLDRACASTSRSAMSRATSRGPRRRWQRSRR